MAKKRVIEEGNLVTVNLGKYNQSSNTYVVYKKIGNFCLLHHPLASECFVLKEEKDLNNVLANLQTPIEKCLTFSNKNKEFLGYSDIADLDALVFYFVFRKTITTKQRAQLSSLCGKISSRLFNNSLQAGADIIEENKALLDDFNLTLYNNFEKIIKDVSQIKTKNERFTLFEIAGFVLSQLGYEKGKELC